MKDILDRIDEVTNTQAGPRVKMVLVDAYAEITNLRARNLSLIETGRKIMDDHTERTNECIRLRSEVDELKKKAK